MADDINDLKDSVLAKLKGSFDNLELAIHGAKDRLGQNANVDPAVVDRINQYETILVKQKDIASQLADNFAAGNFTEVARLVSLINSLSSMIIDDAKQIIVTLQQSSGFGSAEAENDDTPWKNNLC